MNERLKLTCVHLSFQQQHPPSRTPSAWVFACLHDTAHQLARTKLSLKLSTVAIWLWLNESKSWFCVRENEKKTWIVIMLSITRWWIEVNYVCFAFRVAKSVNWNSRSHFPSKSVSSQGGKENLIINCLKKFLVWKKDEKLDHNFV